jgi:hypothetical protein
MFTSIAANLPKSLAGQSFVTCLIPSNNHPATTREASFLELSPVDRPLVYLRVLDCTAARTRFFRVDAMKNGASPAPIRRNILQFHLTLNSESRRFSGSVL